MTRLFLSAALAALPLAAAAQDAAPTEGRRPR